MKKIGVKFVFLAAMVLTNVGCQRINENTVEFETLTENRSITLSNEENSPTCTVSLKLQNATKANEHKGEIINNTVVKRLFNIEDVSMKTAMERFAENYTKNYKETLTPLYYQDRADSTKRAWYEYHYVISAETQKGSKNTVAYIATIDYYEGGAHGVHQQIVMNFEAKTGQQMTLQNIFADGSEQLLNNILLKSLEEKTGLTTLSSLQEKGYLTTTNIFVPDNFIIGDETITFIYNPSEIAPYSEGLTELVIPYESLGTVLKNSFIASQP